ncbi:hypothetical protein [Verminephrobacter aporrectodeae]|uniref:hypothetical protein n=1 Tax=Verminephrobacter aporrectodeae TaxID=1110389 RepID=UPI0022434F6D|nr:hypothetical protein [Verminephrobacter aporrectodeae]MCW8173986.1 hypothetical protein [Verminephrobacter aporrectodeae subsp. tuberculatae]MCW8202015.1 hypothetical protein [Verminephrobacter aporrectodeae subsp. tuberculatae]
MAQFDDIQLLRSHPLRGPAIRTCRPVREEHSARTQPGFFHEYLTDAQAVHALFGPLMGGVSGSGTPGSEDADV